MAAIGLPCTRPSATKKSNSDDQAELARTTEEAAWSAAHETNAVRRAALVAVATAWMPLRDRLPNTDLALLLILVIAMIDGW